MPRKSTEVLSLNQKHALQYVGRYETPEYGVIIRFVTGETLMARGYMAEAKRRRYSRDGGICVRLTEKGRKWLSE